VNVKSLALFIDKNLKSIYCVGGWMEDG
jgi:hypothetical protein